MPDTDTRTTVKNEGGGAVLAAKGEVIEVHGSGALNPNPLQTLQVLFIVLQGAVNPQNRPGGLSYESLS